MNKRDFILFFGLLLSSCSLNLYSPIDTNVINLDKEEQVFLKNMTSLSDTILTLRESDCEINSEDYFIVVYKLNGYTKSKAFTTYGNYPCEPNLEDFNWGNVLSSLDSIKYQKTKPSYFGSIIEGDTTWHKAGSYSGEKVWTFKVYTKSYTTIWETVSSERQANPSMARTKVSEYILSETYNKIWGMTQQYGERIYKKKPIIGRRE